MGKLNPTNADTIPVNSPTMKGTAKITMAGGMPSRATSAGICPTAPDNSRRSLNTRMPKTMKNRRTVTASFITGHINGRLDRFVTIVTVTAIRRAMTISIPSAMARKTAKKSGGLVTTDKLLDQYLKQSEELENLTKIPKEITSDTFVNDIAKDLI